MSNEQQQGEWSDEQHAAYQLGMQTEREHQNALSRLVMEKRAATIDDLRATVTRLTQELAQLAAEKREAISIIQSLGLPIEGITVETITREYEEGGDDE